MIKNVILDIGDVLADFRWKDLMEDLGFSEAAKKSLEENMVKSPLWHEMDRGTLEGEDVIKVFQEANPEYQKEVAEFFGNVNALVEPFDYAVSFIKELKEKGYKVYLLSNYPSFAFSMHAKEKFTFLPYVDGKVISGFIKMVKPERDIYEYLLSQYDLLAEECVFLDDRQENVEGAKEVGMKGIVFRSYSQARQELDKML